MTDKPVFQVSECIEVINHHLSLLGEIIVEGELSRFDLKNGRLIFGTLKDASSAMDIFTLPYLVKNFRQFEPGMLVHAYGTPGLYKGSGKFRFYVSELIPQGEGALQLAYDKLKQQLASEGLFAVERKRPLPPWPKRIGLLTAPGSSAQADLLKILTARMGNLHLMTLPVNVQGHEAVPSLLRAFSYINHHSAAFDLIIMARGGGSLEDLAAFNSEEICRAVFGCPLPVISAIGHEDNWSLTDFVADIRASTPSNAAELAVRDSQAVLKQIVSDHQLLHQQLIRTLKAQDASINQSAILIRRHVKQLTATINQTLGKVPVIAVSLKSLLLDYQRTLNQTLPLLHSNLKNQLALNAQNLKHLERLLASLDYQSVLNRGYSITRARSGDIIKNAAQVKNGDQLTTQLAQGEINSVIN